MSVGARCWLAIGAVLGFLAVAAGAFGAHALQDRLALEGATIYHTAVQYHFYHALAVLAVGILMHRAPQRLLHLAGAAFVAGAIAFSGSLYLMAITGWLAVAMVTPVGGLLFLAGWLLLLAAMVRAPRA